MSDSGDDTREEGIEFGDLYGELESADYPMTLDDVLDEYGDRELETAKGTTTVEEVLGPMAENEDDDQEFDSAEGVRQMVLNMVGREAVGRDEYSGRGATPETNQEEESESGQQDSF